MRLANATIFLKFGKLAKFNDPMFVSLPEFKNNVCSLGRYGKLGG